MESDVGSSMNSKRHLWCRMFSTLWCATSMGSYHLGKRDWQYYFSRGEDGQLVYRDLLHDTRPRACYSGAYIKDSLFFPG